MNVVQIVITLEIYGVKKIVGIPFGYRGFSDKELTEVTVIACLPLAYFGLASVVSSKDIVCRTLVSIDSLTIVCYHSQLSRKVVQNIHLSGGSLLGVSRGGPGVSDIVDSLEVVDLSYLLKTN